MADVDAYYRDNPGKMKDSVIETILRRSTDVCKTGPGSKEMKKCLVLILAVFMCVTACGTTAGNVVTGGAIGAGTGAAIGAAAGNPGTGAAIGAGAGVLGGFLYDQLNR